MSGCAHMSPRDACASCWSEKWNATLDREANKVVGDLALAGPMYEDHALREENVRLRQRVEELEGQQQGLILERDQLLDIQKESEAKLARVVEAGELLLAAYGEAHALYNLGECEGSVKMRAALSFRKCSTQRR